MCLILFGYKQHEEYNLVMAANRDEFFKRPTTSANWWKQEDILAGRDLIAGGTWLGINRNGRFAALTNIREPENINPDAPSRGNLVSNFLKTPDHPEQYLEGIVPNAQDYNGFNLLVGDPHQLWYYSNRIDSPQALGPGIYGLSNHLLDTPWPKVRKGKEKLARVLQEHTLQSDSLFNSLEDREMAADAELPSTGVPLEWERALSSMYIETENYGTRSSTVLLLSEHQVSFHERGYVPESSMSEHFHITVDQSQNS